VSTDQFNSLSVPCPTEYISVSTIAVQSAYITSVESVISKHIYFESGFNELDSLTNSFVTNLVLKFVNGFRELKDALLGLDENEDELIKMKINSVLFMTDNYYKNKIVHLKKSEVRLGEVLDIEEARSILIPQRCRSSYDELMAQIKIIKNKYKSLMSGLDYNNIKKENWDYTVVKYNEVRQEIDKNMNAFASIRDAFIFGKDLSMCEGSTNTNEKLLVSTFIFLIYELFCIFIVFK